MKHYIPCGIFHYKKIVYKIRPPLAIFSACVNKIQQQNQMQILNQIETVLTPGGATKQDMLHSHIKTCLSQLF